MPSKIRILSDHTINKIAAGEVIENPASVVKELVENSLDAGASDIVIEIKGGGRQLIRISDNGCGMSQDDALLCLERHATSKIREVEDIHTIATMGFRGEAIPSIASISKFTLLTRLKASSDESLGTLITIDAGKVLSCAPAACSTGTTIEVKSLFFNTPVRKKFLKSPTVDMNEILKMISSIALGYPHVKFQLINDNKTMILAQTSSTQTFIESLKKRIETILGEDYLHHCIDLNFEQDGISLQGMIGAPSYTRHNRTGQFLFINHRAVFSPLVAYAIKEGYGTALPSGRHPVFVLHLSLCGSLVDVNVHPQKREVRLRQEQTIKSLIIKGIEQALQSSSFHRLPSGWTQPSSMFDHAMPSLAELPSHPWDDHWGRPSLTFPTTPPKDYPTTPIHPPFILQDMDKDLPIHIPLQNSDTLELLGFSSPATRDAQLPKQISSPRVIATIPRYILLDAATDPSLLSRNDQYLSQKNTGLFLIDQRAAHARIIFEQLQDRSSTDTKALQNLLIPYPIEVSSFEAALLASSLETLQSMGIHMQEFGNHTFAINAVPQIFANSNLDALIANILQALRDPHGEQILQEEQSRRIALAASRSAISHERKLSFGEAQGLIDQLYACRHPFQCPQGKAILLQLSLEELAKQFHKQHLS